MSLLSVFKTQDEILGDVRTCTCKKIPDKEGDREMSGWENTDHRTVNIRTDIFEGFLLLGCITSQHASWTIGQNLQF